ncbi:thioredoxin family protein [Pseudoteredinibacter isoporae]|uniref:thioredoxin family protein n=1 Tax=Pseudoteredinibacter isoporae TaxID=570281 RepID=UPI0031065C5B
MSEHVIEISKNGHDSTTPLVLLWFSARWCGPCQAMAPVLELVEEVYSDTMTVIKVDADQQQTLVKEFGIRAVPSFVLLARGGIIDARSGATGYKDLSQWLDHHLSNTPD